jgi:hypothetical protein
VTDPIPHVPAPGRRALLRAQLAGAALQVLHPARAQVARGFAQRTGSVLTPPPRNKLALPHVTRIPIPAFPDMHAIWGSSGRDDSGQLWFGVSAVSDHCSGHLMQFDPATSRTVDRGDVLTALRTVRKLRPGEGQIKIHTRITEADDGCLYFSSTDEQGEADDGRSSGIWGGHLWRLRRTAAAPQWEHLLELPEGLTCTIGAGRNIYILGLWDHVLYRYNIDTGDVRRRVVGSVGGHMTRQIVVDGRGHVFVPRVTSSGKGVAAQLVEFDPDLVELAATKLEHYADGQTPGGAHGIIGFTYLADQPLVIATGSGHLYRIVSPATGPATVAPLGWMHPAGKSYTPCLFVWDGAGQIAGLSQPDGHAWQWDWVVFDLATSSATATRFRHDLGPFPLFYGSHTRDNDGRFYVVGRYHDAADRKLPFILQLDTR